jgi:hypothetical protein
LRPPSSKKHCKMHWRFVSSNRVPALQAQSPEFKPESHPPKKKKKAVGGVVV